MGFVPFRRRPAPKSEPETRSPWHLMAGAGLSFALVTFAIFAPGCGSGSGTIAAPTRGLPGSAATQDQVTRGRYLVIASGCSDCHNRGKDDPSDPKWLAGFLPGTPGQPFQIGPFQTYPANLTPDATGLAGFTDQQIFNALRYGLDPADTPSVVITGTTPGIGNFPTTPHYLAPPMPWPAIRHFSDDDIWSIVAYLKHGIKAVNNVVPDSTGPPDNWASSYTPAAIGPAQIPGYPASNEHFNP